MEVGTPTTWAAEGPGQCSVPNLLPFSVAGLITAVASGGLILGVGPFGNQIVRDGYIGSEDVGRVFTGAFQIMTWGSIIAVAFEKRVGPRLSAALGACLAIAGHTMLASLPAPADRNLVMLAYGFLGWGGNHIFFSTFQFTQLFPNRVARFDGILTGLFNTSALIFLIFNVSTMTIRRFFHIWVFVGLFALTSILVFWPDKAYSKGDHAFLSWPTLKHVHCSDGTSGPVTRRLRSVVNIRFVLYVLTFAWSCAISQYVLGQVTVCHPASVVGDFYSEWAFPLVSSPTILFSWLVGYAIDTTGFALMSLLLILCAQASLLCLYLADSVVAAWCNLVLLNWTSAIQYTIEFAFLHKALEQDAISIGLLIVLVTQGLCGFIPMALSPNPWGDNFVPPLLIMAIPTVILYLWPLYEWRQQHCRRRQLRMDQSPLQGGGA